MIPKTIEQAAEFERRLGEALNRMAEVAQQTLAAKQQLDEGAATASAPYYAEAMMLAQAIHRFAEENREMLAVGGKKTIALRNAGDIRWYETPASVIYSLKPKTIIEHIKKLRLAKKFLRIKTEIDKQALLKNRDVAKRIRGISIEQGEAFAIRPAGSDTRIVRDHKGEWSLDTKKVEQLDEPEEE